ncbi:transcriptional regulator GcvA [Marinomonas sp. 2405UD68-3]|uniref:transcriptional regulator GcvA n=1 Tax=Marinomonas sp. 2405UD68-3 TaxID=3391835 RepID=UPI0039C8C640
MNRLPPLNALKSFESAARHGSFNKAAQELFVTPSAISHQIKSLESFLGIELFHRTKRKVILTEAGEEYIQPIKRVFELIEVATNDMLSKQNEGSLHLAVTPIFLNRWLMPRLGDFYSQHPEIELEISTTSGLINFDVADIDIAVYFGLGEWDDVESHFLKSVALVPVCNPTLIKKDMPINCPEDMRFYPLLHVIKRKEEWRGWIKQHGLDPKLFRRGLMFSTGSLTAGAAIQGLGIALVDPELVQSDVESGNLEILFDQQLITDRSFYLVHQKRRSMTPAMLAFKAWLTKEIKSSQAET